MLVCMWVLELEYSRITHVRTQLKQQRYDAMVTSVRSDMERTIAVGWINNSIDDFRRGCRKDSDSLKD